MSDENVIVGAIVDNIIAFSRKQDIETKYGVATIMSASVDDSFIFWRGHLLNNYIENESIDLSNEGIGLHIIENVISKIKKESGSDINVNKFKFEICTKNPTEDDVLFVKHFFKDVLHKEDDFDEATFRDTGVITVNQTFSIEMIHTFGTMIENGLENSSANNTTIRFIPEEQDLIRENLIKYVTDHL